MTLCGCGPSPKELADKQAHADFRKAVAAVKVCTQGSTYDEFRDKRMALETCYTANQSSLADEATAIERLVSVMKATDLLWDRQIKYPLVELSTSGDEWSAMLVLCPAISGKSSYTWQQRQKDADFNPENYVKLGLILVSKQCDELLK
jgi:hypothetical protein